MHAIFAKAESMGGTPILLPDLEEADLLVSRQLYHMLVMPTTDDAQRFSRTVSKGTERRGGAVSSGSTSPT